MKHLKTFENNEIEPEVGDYVSLINIHYNSNVGNFFNSHVGKIFKINKTTGYYGIRFDEKFKDTYSNAEDEFFLYFDDIEIEFFSKNKEDVELYKASKKYNL